MTYTLTGMSSLGAINKEESNKDAGLFFMPMPTANSDQAIQFDLFGATRTISIAGRFTVADGSISTFIGELDSLINGNQTAKTFHSDKSNNDYSVLVTAVRWNSDDGGVNYVDYTITMQEGGS